VGVVLLGVLILTIALAGCSSSSDEITRTETAKKTTAPPAPLDEYKNFQSSYADVDQQNTRNARSALKVKNVARLEQAWSRPIEGTGEGEGFVASPIVTDNIVFVQDLDSNVAALNLSNGEPYWEKRFDAPALPPGGLSVSRGFQIVMGVTPTEAFGLDERSGKEVWSIQLADRGSGTRIEGITPGYYNGLAFVATRPEDGEAGASGVLWGLDVRSGEKRLRFEPGARQEGLGRGVTGLPAFDFKGSLYVGTGAPGPGAVASIDETNGRLNWSARLVPVGRSAGAWDPVVAKLGETKFLVVADRSGTVFAFDRKGKVLWRHSSGSEVVGPIAVSGGTAFVPTGDGRQGFLGALNLSNGTLQWKHGFQSSLSGPTLVTNDVVFTTSADGRVYALSAKSGKKLWSEKVSSAIEGGLTLAGNTLLVRAGAPESNPGPELVAYRLGGKAPRGGSVADPG
jgi:alcohol dehydrogenase (cytochrome c)